MSTPKTLTVTECHQLLDALLPKVAEGSKFRKALRNHAMALLMLDAGLRVGEVVKLEMADLYYGGVPVSSLVVQGRIAHSKKERTIPLSERIRNALVELYDKCPMMQQKLPAESFTTDRTDARLITTRQVERIIRRAAVQSIGRPIHPHVLRHTFGTRIERKAGIRVAMELLGHTNLSSTQIYTHPNSDDLKKAISEICEDPQEKHLLITDSALDTHAANRGDAAGAHHDHS